MIKLFFLLYLCIFFCSSHCNPIHPKSRQQPQFPTLTRMLSYSEMTNAMRKILSHFKWEIYGFFLHNYDDATKGYSPCHHIIAPINRHSNASKPNSNVHETFENATYDALKEKLFRLKQKSRSKWDWKLFSVPFHPFILMQ